MKAIVQDEFGFEQVLKFDDVETPIPKDDEVLIRVAAASMGAWVWHTMIPDPPIMRLLGAGFRKPRQRIPGNDVAGVVEAVGAKVTGLAPGDHVYGEGAGAFAEYVCTKQDHVAIAPKNLTLEEAAAVPIAAATALLGLREEGNLASGQKVLILGASGGVGTFAVQIAKAIGADVTATCRTDAIGLVRSLGADHIVDYTSEDVLKRSGRFDLIFQLSGTTSALKLRRLLAPTGRLVLCSGDGGKWIGPIGRIAAALVSGVFVRQKFRAYVARVDQAILAELTELIETKAVVPVIEKAYPLPNAAEAVRHVRLGHARGKTLVTV